MEYVGQVMIKSVKRRRFLEYVSQVMAKVLDDNKSGPRNRPYWEMNVRRPAKWTHNISHIPLRKIKCLAKKLPVASNLGDLASPAIGQGEAAPRQSITLPISHRRFSCEKNVYAPRESPHQQIQCLWYHVRFSDPREKET